MASSQPLNPEDLNVLAEPLQQHGTSPITGFFRDGFCRPSASDPAEHTLAGVLTKEFLEYSKSQDGEKIVPRVNLRGTSMTALGEGNKKVTREELERFKE
ncbi:hypothetical protein QFC21_006855 [Naganishia friedmannii]|uniref:Uncharacterized protein n=1 Tax=Naganishia friedmannii TaxID=89922 RepID=A0ACC2V0A2_9TREE|nr:hypothetical protein QFC21_006855 [Naganishia friedmannii]